MTNSWAWTWNIKKKKKWHESLLPLGREVVLIQNWLHKLEQSSPRKTTVPSSAVISQATQQLALKFICLCVQKIPFLLALTRFPKHSLISISRVRLQWSFYILCLSESDQINFHLLKNSIQRLRSCQIQVCYSNLVGY